MNPGESVGDNGNVSRRRGGVRTRGGRLPPIMSRIPATTTAASSGKKSFVPTIPQRRIKTKENDSASIKKEYDHYKSDRGDRRQRSRGGRMRREYIQTVGSIFGQGLAAQPKKTTRDGAPDIKSISYKPVFKRTKKSRKEIEDANREIYDGGCGYSSSSDENEDDFTNEIVRLPLKVQLKSDNVKTEIKKEKVEQKSEKDMNEDPNEFDEVNDVLAEVARILSDSPDPNHGQIDMTQIKIKPDPDGPTDETAIKPKIQIKKEPDDDYEEKLFGTKQEYSEKDDDQLFFIQFPSRLPFEKLKIIDDSKPSTSTKSQNEQTEDQEEDVGTYLKDIKEGHIGKMQFLKSGDVRLCIGDAVMGLHCEDRLYFLQQAVTMSTDEHGADITVIGNLDKSLLCYPVAEDCLRKINIEN